MKNTSSQSYSTLMSFLSTSKNMRSIDDSILYISTISNRIALCGHENKSTLQCFLCGYSIMTAAGAEYEPILELLIFMYSSECSVTTVLRDPPPPPKVALGAPAPLAPGATGAAFSGGGDLNDPAGKSFAMLSVFPMAIPSPSGSASTTTVGSFSTCSGLISRSVLRRLSPRSSFSLPLAQLPPKLFPRDKFRLPPPEAGLSSPADLLFDDLLRENKLFAFEELPLA
mmetsp:Transcript_12771/g.27852  ORF Transcript_12771/g.27852 Transcript_12771/m.27852 type:complete len:227 (-) Transcript_12771:53-733(-)